MKIVMILAALLGLASTHSHAECERWLSVPAVSLEAQVSMTYRALLEKSGSGIVSDQELVQMLHDGNLFQLQQNGVSERGALRDGLAQLRAYVEKFPREERARIEDSLKQALKELVSRRIGEKVQRDQNQQTRKDVLAESYSFGLSQRALSFSPDSKFLFGAQSCQTLSRMDLRTGEMRGEANIIFGTSQVTFDVSTPDRQWRLSASTSGVTLWRYSESGYQPVRSFPIEGDPIFIKGMAISPDGKQFVLYRYRSRKGMPLLVPLELLIVSSDGKVRKVRQKTPRLYDKNDFWFTPNGDYLFVRPEGENSLFRLRLGDLKLQRKFPVGGSQISSISADGGRVLAKAVTQDGSEEYGIWDATDGHRISTLENGFQLNSRKASFSPDGKYVIGTDNGEIRITNIRIWDAMTGRLVFVASGVSDRRPTHVAISADGNLVAVATALNHVQLYSTSPEKLLFEKEVLGAKGSFDDISRLMFSPDGRFLVVQKVADGTVFNLDEIWETSEL